MITLSYTGSFNSPHTVQSLGEITHGRTYNDEDMQDSRAANPFIRYSPAPLTQQPTIKGAPEGPFEDAQQPAPYIAASPTRPLTCEVVPRCKRV